MNADVERMLYAHDPQIAGIARSLCERILDVLPDAVVTVGGGDVGFGTDAGYQGLVFTVSPHKAHVTLGIDHGADLPDPAGLMEGSGKVHRHVKVRTVGEVDRPGLRELLATRVEQAR